MAMEGVSEKCKINRTWIREMFAEFIGTFILVLVGDASVAQMVLSRGAAGQFLSVNIAYGLAAMLGVLLSGGVSGGHINPAVTVAMALVGKFPWLKMFHYMVAQYLGAFVASAVILLVYHEALNDYDGGDRDIETAGIWATYPKYFLSLGGGFADQVVGTFVLLIAVCAITDYRNMKIHSSLVPLFVGLTIVAIGLSLGFNCGYAINPARDLGPRLFTLIAGWGGKTFTFADFAWVPIVGPHIGAILGAVTYIALVEFHWPKGQETDMSEIGIKD